MANKQLTDVNSDEYVVGLGYRVKNVAFAVRSLSGGGKTNFNSDLDIKVDFSIRNNRTVLRRLDIDQNQVSAGQQVVTINTTIDYQLSRSLSMSFFFDKIINNPYVSNQYRNSTTRGGIRLRFSLAQ
jgi:cell surface protein SprA